MADSERVQDGSDEGGYTKPPLFRYEQLMQAHPDISVVQTRLGELYIYQALPEQRERVIAVEITHEEGSTRHYPSVILRAYERPEWKPSTPATIVDIRRHAEIKDIRRHGLKTLVKLHVADDEQVTPEIGYEERQRYPSDYTRRRIQRIQEYAHPIPAQEIVAATRIGLEMLKTGREERKPFGIIVPQIQDFTSPHFDEDIAAASPLIGAWMKREGISYNHVRTLPIYALNALNKVTDAMLPSEMPPAPRNSREPQRRATTTLSAARRRSARG